MREHYNKSKKDNQAILQCTPEKEEAIIDALRHFKMIQQKWMVFMRQILKIILFPISLLLSILTVFLTFLLAIGKVILYLLMMFCIFRGNSIFFTKRGYHWYRSLNYRIFTQSLWDTDGWSINYSIITRYKRKNNVSLNQRNDKSEVVEVI